SPFPNELRIPGTEVFGFLAGACVMRRTAFVQCGGYHRRLFIGGEEALLAIDFMAAGWRMAYVPDIVVYHDPSILRNARGRRRLLIRNALWCAWLRRSIRGAIAETAARLGGASSIADAAWSAIAALRG